MTFAIFMAKIATPFLSEWLNQILYGAKKKKNSSVNFDLMVEQKKSQLRGSSKSQEIQNYQQKAKSNASAFEARIFARFQELSSLKSKKKGEEKELEDLKQLIKLFDGQQWGGGEQFRPIAQSITNNIKMVTTPELTSELLKKALASNIFQRKNAKSLASIEDIKQYLTLAASLHHFKSNELFRARFTKLEQTSQLHAYQSLHYLYLQAKGSTAKQSLKELNLAKMTLPMLTKDLELIIFLDKQQHFVSLQDLQSQLTRALNLISSLTKLPVPKNKNDIETALAIYGFKTVPKMELIKKRHRKLAMERHPDKLGSVDLPSDLERQITENFAMIQLAYEILAQQVK